MYSCATLHVCSFICRLAHSLTHLLAHLLSHSLMHRSRSLLRTHSMHTCSLKTHCSFILLYTNSGLFLHTHTLSRQWIDSFRAQQPGLWAEQDPRIQSLVFCSPWREHPPAHSQQADHRACQGPSQEGHMYVSLLHKHFIIRHML